jgi:hypothetical protein
LWGAFRHEKLLAAEHGVPSTDLSDYDAGKPVLAVDMGQEAVDCPISNIAEPKCNPPAGVSHTDAPKENT